MQTYKELIRVLSVQGNRDESGTVDMAKATKEANDLFQVKKWQFVIACPRAIYTADSVWPWNDMRSQRMLAIQNWPFLTVKRLFVFKGLGLRWHAR